MKPGDSVPLVEMFRGDPGDDDSIFIPHPTAEAQARITNPQGGSVVSVMRVNDDGSAQIVTDEMKLSGAGSTEVDVAAPEFDSAPEVEPGMPATDRETCDTTLVNSFHQIPGVVAELWPGPNAEAWLTYSRGSTSTLGIAISGSGQYGTWTGSGGKQQSSQTTIGYPTVRPGSGGEIEQTYWTYGLFKTRCYGLDPFKGAYSFQWYEAQPTGWETGNPGYRTSSTPTASNCAYFRVTPGRPTLVKSSGKSQYLSNGVNLKWWIGIDVSTQTSFGQNTQLTYNMLRPGYLCGTDAFPDKASRVVGK